MRYLLKLMSVYLIIFFFSGCEETDEILIDKIIISGLGNFVELNKSIQLNALGVMGNNTTPLPSSEITWTSADNEMFTMDGSILTSKKNGTTKIICVYKDIIEEKSFEIKQTVFLIENMNPPTEFYDIDEGSCGEAVLWSICKQFEENLTQQEINMIGGNPGRGLHFNEVVAVLDTLNIPFKLILKRYTWEASADNLITVLISGNPIFLGVKIYPDRHPQWGADHFILLTGIDILNNNFYYNSFTERGMVSYEKLTNTQNGYSLINKYNSLFAIEILLASRK